MKTLLKKMAMVMILTAGSSGASAQNGGTVVFQNLYGAVDAPFFNEAGERLDENYIAQIYALKSGVGFLPVEPTTRFFSKEKKKGYFRGTGGMVEVPFIVPGDPVSVQVRAWIAEGGATFEEAALTGAWTGVSNTVYLSRTGGYGQPPYLPVPMVGLKYPGPPIIVKQPESQTTHARRNVTLSVVASSGVKATYQWYQEPSDTPGGLIRGANAPTYSPPNLKQDTAFWVTITNSAGSVTSEAVKVTVLEGHYPRLGIQVHREAGQVQIIIDGISGVTYDIQFANSLAEPLRWQPLTQVTADQEVDWFYLKYDPEQPSRFYRAIELP
jgi:hypothetical protein